MKNMDSETTNVISMDSIGDHTHNKTIQTASTSSTNSASFYPTIWHGIKNYFPYYQLQSGSDLVKINERPPIYKCIVFGLQHVLAMFSGTVFIPMQMGFDINTALFFSGISTILFFIVVRGRVPCYLGSSGSATSAVLSITGFVYGNGTLNPNISAVQGALVILGLMYVGVSLLVFVFGYKWIRWIMPPVVVGSVVASIGLHLVYSSFHQATSTPFDTYMALTTILATMFIAVYAPFPLLRRLCILSGAIVGYIINLICGLKGAGPPIDFSQVSSSPWIRAPMINSPILFQAPAISTVAPVLIVLLAENMGHLQALSSITQTPLDHHLAKTYLGDALATTLCGIVGTAPMTTYAENLIILSVTRIYSPLVIVFAALIAIILGLLTKFGAVVNSIPPGVFGGITLVLYAIITITGIKIWIDNKVDFSDARNIFIGVVPMILASTMQGQLVLGNFQLDGIGCATFSAIILNQLLRGVDGFKEYGNAIKNYYQTRRRTNDGQRLCQQQQQQQ
ncbi:xanthine/uracil permease family protein [Halteromyces radiatus]|uniref:xanthine/uracil permease family protein n=1 Tax=Halteromyces radiatus TaxID=101107 RepID=UPI00222077B8|nr:xanthine/uracil permease family protein [Halteromyces radiatus]KAI8082696.1 xanthine/uracil permease family protein [Halteromyces radiatus]